MNLDVQSVIDNIQISGDMQFDPMMLLEEAKKIGLDFGDLEDYGFKDVKSCSGNVCPNK